MISAIYRAFAILIEYTNESDYKMQVIKVLNESNRILQEKEDWFKRILNVEEEKFNRQYTWIQDLEKQIKRLREIVGEKNNDIQKVKDELKQKG